MRIPELTGEYVLSNEPRRINIQVGFRAFLLANRLFFFFVFFRGPSFWASTFIGDGGWVSTSGS